MGSAPTGAIKKKLPNRHLEWLAEDSGKPDLKTILLVSDPALGLDDPEWFVNGVFLLETGLVTEGTAEALLAIESSLGRERIR